MKVFGINNVDPQSQRNAAIVIFSIVGGLAATWLIPHYISWIPYDYAIYMQGARMVRLGLDPYASLPYWYPLPIVLFTTLPWSFLPDQFAWAFAFIPLGLLHLRFGRRALLWWLFFPLLINVAYAQAEGWLILPLMWLLEDAPVKASFGIIALLFKPAYGIFLVPYRIYEWVRLQYWKRLAWLICLSAVIFSVAFLIDGQWVQNWFYAVSHRAENAELNMRNMTIWAFAARGGLWLIPLSLLSVAFGMLAVPLWRCKETQGIVLVALALFVFPNGLNPVSSMMVIPFVQSTRDIVWLAIFSWLVAGFEILVGGLGGLYLLIVLAAMVLRARSVLSTVKVN